MVVNSDELDHMLTMLEALVNIDSGSYDKEGVNQVGQYLKRRFEKLDFIISEEKSEDTGDHLILRHKQAKEPKILILAHMDTVFPMGTVNERPFKIEGNRAYGPGVIDMKASHVMLYYAVKNLIENDDMSYKNIEVILNADEEIGTISSRHIIEKRAKDKKCVLVLEPAREDGSIVSSRRGVGEYKLKIKGVAAHSGIEPEKGSSAIEELGHKILELQALSNPKENINVNVGLIEGGTSVNTVAPIAEANIDVRISTVEQGTEVDKKIREICAEAEVKGTELELTGGINRPPMIYTEETETLVHLIQEEAKKLGVTVEHTATGGGSDASFTAAMNIPTIDGLGPVGGKQHSKEEYLEIDSLMERKNLFMNVLSNLSK